MLHKMGRAILLYIYKHYVCNVFVLVWVVRFVFCRVSLRSLARLILYFSLVQVDGYMEI
jgi:hypothetical protein